MNMWMCFLLMHVWFRWTDWSGSLDWTGWIWGWFLERDSNTDWGGWSEPLSSSRFVQLQIFPKHYLNLEIFPFCSCYSYYITANRRSGQKRTMFAFCSWSIFVKLLFINRWSCSWQSVCVSAVWGVLPSTQLSFSCQRKVNAVIHVD